MSGLLSLWFIWCLLGGVSLIFALKSMIRWLLTANNQEVTPDIDRMEGKAFEAYVAEIFVDLGYRVQLTKASHDYGADLILERASKRTAVQAKRQSDSVGLAAIQQVVAAKAMYACSEAMVVTNTMYTQSALNLAQANLVELWDRPLLLSAIATRAARRRQARLQAQALHRMSSLAAVLIAGVLLSCGLVGFWRQGFSALRLANQPLANNLSRQPFEAEPSMAAAALEPTASSTSAEASSSEDDCGSAVVQVVAALAIRQEPLLQSAAVGEVPQGREIKLVCTATVAADGISWQLVDYGRGRGWMSRKYLLVEQP